MTSIPGLRINETNESLLQASIEGFKHFPTPDISDTMHGMYCLNPDIKNLVNSCSLMGSAFTVKLPPFDNLLLHKALDLVKPGDIVVVQAGGRNASTAVCGDLLAHKLLHKEVAGLVIDGLVRDLPGLKALGLPIYARGTTPVAPHKKGAGEINVPIACGEQVVMPRDLIIADNMGVIVIPQKDIHYVLKKLQLNQKSANEYKAKIQAGDFNTEWVNKALCHVGLATNNTESFGVQA